MQSKIKILLGVAILLTGGGIFLATRKKGEEEAPLIPNDTINPARIEASLPQNQTFSLPAGTTIVTDPAVLDRVRQSMSVIPSPITGLRGRSASSLI